MSKVASREMYVGIRRAIVARLFPKCNLAPISQDSSLYVSPDRQIVVWAGGGRSLFLGLNKKFIPAISAARTAIAIIYAITDAGTTTFALPIAVNEDGHLTINKLAMPVPSDRNYNIHLGRDRERNWFIKECSLNLSEFNVSTGMTYVNGYWRRVATVIEEPLPDTIEMVRLLKELIATEINRDPFYQIEVRAVRRVIHEQQMVDLA